MKEKSCWCGNQELKEFSSEYSICSQCGTLVLNQELTLDDVRVKDDEHDLYGKEYWLSHQTDQYGYPDIRQRSRQDIPERCLYWLHTLMCYKLPPGKVLELGCAHGGSVALAKWAGFEATGLELSPWVVDFAQKTFEIPMLLGPLEDQQIKPASIDAIVLYDVLEHLPDPLSTMRYAASLLKEDGIFIIQTPNYIEGTTYSEMVAEQDHFLDQLKSSEHLYLFNYRSIAKFFQQLGFEFLQFEQQLFDYDMYFVVSRCPIVRNTDEQIAYHLSKHLTGRLILALLDQSAALKKLQIRYQESESDRAERLKIIDQQGQEIGELRTKLKSSLEQFESDRAGLIKVLGQQGQEIGELRTKLKSSLEQLEQTQAQLTQEKMQVQQLQSFQLQQLQHQINEVESQIKIAYDEVEAMKTSKFWKMRMLWFDFKERLGLPIDS